MESTASSSSSSVLGRGPSPLRYSQLPPYPYQVQCFYQAITENLVIVLPTGKGKTLIAVLVASYYLELYPNLRVMFIVPTRPLVEQQASYLLQQGKYITAVTKILGGENNWRSIMRTSQVIVGTPEAFRTALLDKACIHPAQFSLIIIDECHHATGNSPLISIMQDSIFPSKTNPRILGLTASFVNGAMTNLIEKRHNLEENLNSRLFIPNDIDFTFNGTFFPIIFHEKTNITNWLTTLTNKIDLLMNKFKEIPPKEKTRFRSRVELVTTSLGIKGTLNYIETTLIMNMEAHWAKMEATGATDLSSLAKRLRQLVPLLKIEFKNLVEETRLNSTHLPEYSTKMETLFKLLKEIQQKTTQQHTLLGIVFVSQVAFTYPLSFLLNTHPEFSKLPYRPFAAPVSGNSTMTDTEREKTIKQFRNYQHQVLVTTPALEEGIDVPDCSFVIRFDRIDTTKQHIQGSGRARMKTSEIYYFCNNPAEEQMKAERMQQIAREDQYALPKDEREDKVNTAAQARFKEKYPYLRGKGNEINLFNCLKIFHEYCQKVLGFYDADYHLIYNEFVVCEYPLTKTKYLQTVKVPTPAGFVDVNHQEVHSYWGGTRIEDIADPDRLKNWKTADKEKGMYLYVVVVKMVERNLLDDHNRPSSIGNYGACLSDMKRRKPQLKITGFSKAPLPQGDSDYMNSSPRSYPSLTSHSSPSQSSHAQSPPPSPARSQSSAMVISTPQSLCPTLSNPKGILQNEVMSLAPYSPISTVLSYSSTEIRTQTFRATVRLRIPHRGIDVDVEGDCFPNKKAAEQDAAQKMLVIIRSIGKV